MSKPKPVSRSGETFDVGFTRFTGGTGIARLVVEGEGGESS